MKTFLDEWRSIQNGNYWRYDPDRSWLRWHVAQRPWGWIWYTADYSSGTKAVASEEFGPFSSWEAAAADCDTSYKKSQAFPCEPPVQNED